MKLRMLTLLSVFALILQSQENDLNAACSGCGRGSSLVSAATASATAIVGGGDFADFYALMPFDNAAPVAPGTSVQFPENGPSSGLGFITRLNASQFQLSAIGVYAVTFQVSVAEAGQLVLVLNGAQLPYTVVGRATGTSQIVETALVRTTTANSVLSVNNPVGEAAALTITPLAGGTNPVSAHIVIRRIQ